MKLNAGTRRTYFARADQLVEFRIPTEDDHGAEDETKDTALGPDFVLAQEKHILPASPAGRNLKETASGADEQAGILSNFLE